MRNTKLIRLLASFDDKTHRQLERFLSNSSSRYQIIEKFFKLLRHHAPDYQVSPEAAFAKLYPDRAFDSAAFRRLNNKLYKQIQEFLFFQDYRQDSFKRDLTVLKHFRNKSLTHDFGLQLKLIEKQLESQPRRDSWYYLHRFLLQDEVAHMASTRKDDNDDQRYYLDYTKFLDQFYLLNKQMMHCLKLSHITVINIEFPNLGVEKKTIDILRSLYPEQINSIAWQSCINLLQSSGDHLHHYQNLKQILFKHQQHFNNKDIQNFCICLQNNTPKLFSGTDYYAELFELYTFQIERGVFEQKEYLLTSVLIVNIVIVALKLKRIEWANDFITSYLPKFQQIDESLLLFCRNLVDFEYGHFDLILERHQEYKLDNLAIKINERRLLLKVYYECGPHYWESLETSLQSFATFLHRKRELINERQLKANRSFLSILRKLYQLQDESPTPKQYQTFRQDILETTALPERDWFLTKLP